MLCGGHKSLSPKGGIAILCCHTAHNYDFMGQFTFSCVYHKAFIYIMLVVVITKSADTINRASHSAVYIMCLHPTC